MRIEDPFHGGMTVLAAAHPDDEVIGAGGHLPCLDRPVLIHVTDGAPRNGRDAAAAGFASWQEYARARRQELLRAMAIAGIGPQRALELGYADQETSLELAAVARRLAALFDELRPAIVLTHPYEGGHPDHDATAFAVRAACRLTAAPPQVWEFTSYHAHGADCAAGEFLPAARGTPEIRADLSPTACRLKREMFACFTTQQHVLAGFPIGQERFRPAPEYDFTLPPHAGQLHYERFDWGVTGEQWRQLARQALQQLGIYGNP